MPPSRTPSRGKQRRGSVVEQPQTQQQREPQSSQQHLFADGTDRSKPMTAEELRIEADAALRELIKTLKDRGALCPDDVLASCVARCARAGAAEEALSATVDSLGLPSDFRRQVQGVISAAVDEAKEAARARAEHALAFVLSSQPSDVSAVAEAVEAAREAGVDAAKLDQALADTSREAAKEVEELISRAKRHDDDLEPSQIIDALDSERGAVRVSHASGLGVLALLSCPGLCCACCCCCCCCCMLLLLLLLLLLYAAAAAAVCCCCCCCYCSAAALLSCVANYLLSPCSPPPSVLCSRRRTPPRPSPYWRRNQPTTVVSWSAAAASSLGWCSCCTRGGQTQGSTRRRRCTLSPLTRRPRSSCWRRILCPSW